MSPSQVGLAASTFNMSIGCYHKTKNNGKQQGYTVLSHSYISDEEVWIDVKMQCDEFKKCEGCNGSQGMNVMRGYTQKNARMRIKYI